MGEVSCVLRRRKVFVVHFRFGSQRKFAVYSSRGSILLWGNLSDLHVVAVVAATAGVTVCTVSPVSGRMETASLFSRSLPPACCIAAWLSSRFGHPKKKKDFLACFAMFTLLSSRRDQDVTPP